MSGLGQFIDQVERDISSAARGGCRVRAMYLGPDGEAGLLAANLASPHQDLDVMPELRIHGVPVKVHKSIPGGRFLYLLEAA